jgi:mono/diheme cytochrome c family protein
MRREAAFILMVGLTPVAGAWSGQSPRAPEVRLDAAETIEAGRARFDAACTYCHGAEGEGGKTPGFKGRHDLDGGAIFDVISNGRTRGANIMPAWKGSLSAQARWELVAYILTLEAKPANDD